MNLKGVTLSKTNLFQNITYSMPQLTQYFRKEETRLKENRLVFGRV